MQRKFSAGYRLIELFDKTYGVSFPMVVLYPTDTPEKAEKVETLELEIASNAAFRDGRYPLVVFSHGSGGSPLFYRSLVLYLARNGFIVGMPEHPFDNLHDTSLAGTEENLVNRPRHIQTAIDWFFNNEFSSFLQYDALAIMGHSIGGYTALVVAGGIPASQPSETTAPRQLDVESDPRVRALVLLAPATVWFGAREALSKVNVPILMVMGDKDTYTPYRYHARLVLDGVPDKMKVRCGIVKNIGHFSFMSPLPSRRPQSKIRSQTELDQERFFEELNSEIFDFLSLTLSE